MTPAERQRAYRARKAEGEGRALRDGPGRPAGEAKAGAVTRPLRFTPDENAELAAFLDASGQGFQAWAHDSLLSLARAGIEVGAEPPPPPAPARPRSVPLAVEIEQNPNYPPPAPAPRFTPRPKAAAAKEPKPEPARPEATSGWTRPPGGW